MRTKIALFLLLCLSLGLAGCGSNAFTTAGTSATPTSIPATPGVVTPLTPTASTPSSVSTPSPGTSASGPVTVQTSASFYHAGNTIVVTVANHTAQPIFFPNHQTNCTTVLLQLQVGPSWESMAPCKEMIVTTIQALNGEKSLIISLKAGLTSWPVGNYRVAFHYMEKTATGFGAALDVFSPLFQVG